LPRSIVGSERGARFGRMPRLGRNLDPVAASPRL
jgi:hypothetical protein